jgi:hypothetical protein
MYQAKDGEHQYVLTIYKVKTTKNEYLVITSNANGSLSCHFFTAENLQNPLPFYYQDVEGDMKNTITEERLATFRQEFNEKFGIKVT